MIPFELSSPAKILFGRGQAQKAPPLIRAFGARGLLVHGARSERAEWLINALPNCDLLVAACGGEPKLADLEHLLAETRGHKPDWVVAIGGGAALDMGKALAALIPQAGPTVSYLEGKGPAHRLEADPVPFIALPTTAGTGSEVTKNAVIGLPDPGRKVSLRDDRMLARLAIVDPALTDHCPRLVTLGAGLDALTQVIEPYISLRANPYTDALCLPVISQAMTALIRLMQQDDPAARDQMAWVSLCGGIALTNAGLGAVHGLAGVIGGRTGAAHGAICGRLLAPVMQMNRSLLRSDSDAGRRLAQVSAALAPVLGCTPLQAPDRLADWVDQAGLPKLTALGLAAADHATVAEQALATASMQGNPVTPKTSDLIAAMQAAG